MCGFTGVLKPNKKNDVIKALEISRDIISHRGDDFSKTYIDESSGTYLAFNRLAIVDLDPRSNQPMIYRHQNRSIIGMLNGEIYNYKELKSKLKRKGYQFSTSSDTEVLLALMLEEGIKGIKNLQGIFSIFLFFKDKNKVYLIRDQIGVKPLYYVENLKEWNFLFASEIKAFKPFIDFSPCLEKLREFCVFGETSGSQTIYKGISQLQPGEMLEIDFPNNFKVTKKSYFSIVDLYLSQDFSNKEINEKNLIEIIEHEIKSTILLQSEIEVPHGLLLSGGLDSSIIGGIIKNKKGLNSYSTVANEVELSEEYWQDRVSKYLSIKNYKIRLSDDDYKEDLIKSFIYFNDAPLQHPNFIPCFQMCKSGKSQKLKVFLSGDGADEFFSGYKWLKPLENFSKIENIIHNSAFNSISSISKLFNKKTIDISPRINYLRSFDEKNFPNQNLVLSHIYMQRYYLQKWLHRQDRTGMANGIEIRVPFCDIKLISKYINLRAKSVHSFAGNKSDLKKVAIKYLPKDVVHREKIGFPLPLEDLFSNNGLFFFNYKKHCRKKFFKNGEMINSDYASELALDHLNKKSRNGRLLWTLFNTELWLSKIND